MGSVSGMYGQREGCIHSAMGCCVSSDPTNSMSIHQGVSVAFVPQAPDRRLESMASPLAGILCRAACMHAEIPLSAAMWPVHGTDNLLSSFHASPPIILHKVCSNRMDPFVVFGPDYGNFYILKISCWIPSTVPYLRCGAPVPSRATPHARVESEARLLLLIFLVLSPRYLIGPK
jgi:hypothetical protein